MRNTQRFLELLRLTTTLLSLLLWLTLRLLAHLHALALLFQLLHGSPQLRHHHFVLLRRFGYRRLVRSALTLYHSHTPREPTQRLDLTRLLFDLLAQHRDVRLVSLNTTLCALFVLLLRDDIRAVRFLLLFQLDLRLFEFDLDCGNFIDGGSIIPIALRCVDNRVVLVDFFCLECIEEDVATSVAIWSWRRTFSSCVAASLASSSFCSFSLLSFLCLICMTEYTLLHFLLERSDVLLLRMIQRIHDTRIAQPPFVTLKACSHCTNSAHSATSIPEYCAEVYACISGDTTYSLFSVSTFSDSLISSSY